MSFKQKLTLLLAVFAFVTSTVLAAGVPPTVKNVKANIVNGALTVTWDAVTDPDGISLYRVYYSHQSILGNGGDYDDFEETTGPVTTYTFARLPLTSEAITVSVLAVNSAGIESEGFETEATVALPTSSEGASQSMVSSVTSSVATTATPMEIVSAEAVTATGVLLTFTKPIEATVRILPEHFVILDGSGGTLEVTDVEVGTSVVLIHTAPQSSRIYVLGILQPIPAFDGTNLLTGSMQTFFQGMAAVTGTGYVPTPMPMQPTIPTGPLPPNYVRNPTLPAQPVERPIPTPTPVPVKENPLPDSGLGITGIAVVSALLAGRKLRKKK